MIESILLAFIIALLSQQNIIPTLTQIMMIPVYISTLLYIVMIVLELFKLPNPLKKCIWLMLVLISITTVYFIIKYSLYRGLIIGLSLFFIGLWFNQIVVKANDNKMPVFPKFIKINDMDNSETHQLGNKDIKLKFLSDIFDFKYNIFSIGDFCIFSVYGIVMYGVISRLG